MHSRVTTIQVLPGMMDELVRIYEETLLPATKEQEGFRGSLLLRDPEEDRAMLITWWATEADLLANEASGYYEEKMKKVAHTLSGASTVKRFDTRGGR